MLDAARHSQSAGAGARNRNRSITPSCGQPRGGGGYWLTATGPSGNSPMAGSPMQRRRVTSVPGRALARRNSSTSWPISHSPRPPRLATAAVRGAAGRPRSRMVTSIQPPRTLTVTVTGCASPDPYRMALVAASLADGQDQVVDHLVRDGTWHLRQAVSDGTPQLGKAARRASKRNLHVLPPARVCSYCRGACPWADAMVWPRLTRSRAPDFRAAGLAGWGLGPAGKPKRRRPAVVGDGPLPGSRGGGHEAPTRARRPAAGWPAPGPPVPGWTPRAAPPVGRGAPAPDGGWRCRVRARRPCPPGRVGPPAAADAWRAGRPRSARPAPAAAHPAGRARRRPAAVGPG